MCAQCAREGRADAGHSGDSVEMRSCTCGLVFQHPLCTPGVGWHSTVTLAPLGSQQSSKNTMPT